MNALPSPSHFPVAPPPAILLTLSFLLSMLLLNPACAQDQVPSPRDSFSPDAALILYADLQTASRSGIWKTLETKLAPLAGQMAALSGMPAPMPGQLQGLPGIQSDDTAELAIVIAGKNALQNLQSGQFDRDFAFTVVGRLTEPVGTEIFVQQILSALESEKPGVRDQLEKNRTQVGAAAFFELPAELLGPASIPFPVGAAVGQGEAGTIFGFGKSDSLRAFLARRTDARLPAGLAGNLARRGQIWIYLPLHQSMAQSLSGGGMENPMIEGLAQGLDKVNEMGMSLSFGSSKIDVELAFGCADNRAARELTQNMQQFIGIMQMVSAQNPGATPPFLGKLKAASDGSTFRLTSEFTPRDLDLALQTISPAATATPRRSTGGADLPPVEFIAPPPIPLTVEVLELLPGDTQSLRHTRLRIENHSRQAVRDVRLTFHYRDQNGQRIGQWTRRHMDPVRDTVVGAETSREIRCPIFHVPTSTRSVTATLHEVTFADGSKWFPSR
jgi:hypothetical protein